MRRINELIAFAAILLLALAIRLQGINFGLPAQIHPDEPVLFLTARELNETGGINQAGNPIGYSYPPLFVRLLQYEQKVIRLIGGEEATQAFYFLWGRATSVLFSVLTVYFGILLTRRFLGAIGGFLCGTFLAVNPLLSEHARLMTVDSTVTFLIILTIFLSLLAIEKGTRKWSFFGLAVALAAVATKYSALPVLLVPLLSQIIPNVRRKKRIIGIITASFLVIGLTIFLLIARYHMLDSFNVPYSVTGRLFDKENPFDLISLGQNVTSLFENLGGVVPIFIIAAGAILAWPNWRLRRPFFIILAVVAVYLLLLSLFPFSGERHLVPLVALAGPLWAIGVVALRDRLLAKQPLIVVLFAVLVLLPAFVESARQGAFLQQKDTRLMTVEWFAAHAPSGSRIFVEYDAVEFERDYGGYLGPPFSVRAVEAIPQLSAAELQEADYLVSDSRAASGLIASGVHVSGLVEEVRLSNDGRPGPLRVILRVQD